MDYAPRGWNSWDCYGAAVTEDIVRKNAEYMAKNLKDAGYEYIVVDIQWYEPLAVSNEYHPFADVCMDEYGRLIPAKNRFPSAADGKGFSELAQYVHSLGLKFGIHIMRGIPRQAVSQNTPVFGTDTTARDVAKTNSICPWNTDMYGVDTDKEAGKAYYDSIFAKYAEWGVDFIKCDDICRELPKEEGELIALSESLQNCGREMVLSLSPGPALLEKAELYKQVSNMWRITDDFWDNWKSLYDMFERAEKWSIHAGRNHFPDADMLPVGAVRQCYDPANATNFTKNEQVTMMLLWCIMRSPLMIGSELTKLDDWTLSLLTNKRLLEMHQNSRHAHQVIRRKFGEQEIVVWTAVNAADTEERYVALFNLSDEKCNISLDMEELELS
ncbi:MAG: glycoside hydrolase family 27 protein, partial [Clostridium sp.]|nr:glycoside hydrolase family 27 protein [Clostridium sp.]